MGAEVEDSEVQSEASRNDEDERHDHESEHHGHLTHPMFSHMRDATKPQRILKVDKSAFVGAKYMFPYKPRIVITKRQPQKLTREQRQKQREERRRLRKEKEELAELQAAANAAAGSSVEGGDDNGDDDIANDNAEGVEVVAGENQEEDGSNGDNIICAEQEISNERADKIFTADEELVEKANIGQDR